MKSEWKKGRVEKDNVLIKELSVVWVDCRVADKKLVILLTVVIVPRRCTYNVHTAYRIPVLLYIHSHNNYYLRASSKNTNGSVDIKVLKIRCTVAVNRFYVQRIFKHSYQTSKKPLYCLLTTFFVVKRFIMSITSSMNAINSIRTPSMAFDSSSMTNIIIKMFIRIIAIMIILNKGKFSFWCVLSFVSIIAFCVRKFRIGTEPPSLIIMFGSSTPFCFWLRYLKGNVRSLPSEITTIFICMVLLNSIWETPSSFAKSEDTETETR